MDNTNLQERTHDYFETYLDAYLDGELDLVGSLEIEDHLKQCQRCASNYKNLQALRGAMRSETSYFKASPKLQKSVLSTIRKEDKPTEATADRPWRWLSLVAVAAATVLIVVFGFIVILSRQSTDERLVQEIASDHVRSLMLPDHTLDVVSSDQHTVKPWFDGKIDFAPPVKDLKDQGFELEGGRLDYIGNRSVAALIYKRQKHIINLFIWPSAGNQSVKQSTLQGYNVLHLSKNGMTFWAVSDLNATELEQLLSFISA